jgi:hypothetical protein
MRFPGLELREPLRRRPISGGLIGGLTGLTFGLIAGAAKAFPASPESIVAGYSLGGIAVGVITGSLLPQFRSRWIAGAIVGAAMAVGLLIAVPLWGEDWGIPMTVFMGLCCGIVYAGLAWDYRRHRDSASTTLPNGEV